MHATIVIASGLFAIIAGFRRWQQDQKHWRRREWIAPSMPTVTQQKTVIVKTRIAYGADLEVTMK